MDVMSLNGGELPSPLGGNTDRPRPGAGRHFRMLVKEAQAESARTQLPVETCLRSIWRGLLGLRDYRSRDHARGYVTRFEPDKARVQYEDFPLRDVAAEFLGGGQMMQSLVSPKIGLATAEEVRDHLVRDALAPVTASSQQDGNLFSVYIGGLYEAKFLEGYQSPEFIGREFVKWETTNAREQRIPTTARVPPTSRSIVESTEFPNVGAQPRWVIRPPVFKRGAKSSLTREALAYGLGGTLLQSLQDGGYSLGYIQEYAIAAYIQGVAIPVGDPYFSEGLPVATYLYNQEPGSTYQPAYQSTAGSGGLVMYNYANLFPESSGLQTYLQLQTARQQLSLATEYETGYRINAPLAWIKVGIGQVDNAWNVLHATSVAPVQPGFATSGAPVMTFSANMPGNANIRCVSSAIWDQQLLNAGVSAPDVLDYWYAGEPKKAFGWASVYDTELVPMDPRSASLVSSGIVWAAAYSWIGTPYIIDPRYMIKYTN